ncbi:phosphotransferase [Nocardiopsis sp. YSL2]|uniref:phosphotransferase n=1 Tax=Nocardiopsis sp. YSL2 TaxID=2939492 RepID=UPI0026F47C2E|nr:phosphotransferase [Nocardiopsis sp. YSL2]
MRMTHQHGRRALEALGAELDGSWRLGMLDATVSATATRAGARYWLRVAPVRDETSWVRADAIEESQALAERVPMPRLADSTEWEATDPEDGQVRVRAHLFEYVDQRAVSSEPAITTEPAVDDRWWERLHVSHETIRSSTTAGPSRSAEHVARWVRKVAPDLDTSDLRWESSHGDWHWANLLSPELVVLDWEGFGLAPVGFDAASLLTYSLAHPPTAGRVRSEFADELAGHDGLVAQLYCASWISSAIGAGFHPQLREPLRRHVADLLG